MRFLKLVAKGYRSVIDAMISQIIDDAMIYKTIDVINKDLQLFSEMDAFYRFSKRYSLRIKI